VVDTDLVKTASENKPTESTADIKLSQAKFLESEASGEKFTNSQSQQNAFSKNLRGYREGILVPSDSERQRARKYTSIENKLIAYVDIMHV
jgi:hypothetical protein